MHDTAAAARIAGAASECPPQRPAPEPPLVPVQPPPAAVDTWYVLDPIYAIAGEWAEPAPQSRAAPADNPA